MTNRLINETSPYLLQHAGNPVDWYPWGEEAFAKARAENKPVLVSIGYAACHWCHVMERESFEDDAIAEQMNRQFVAIKVDREERPDVDSIYMQALMSIHGSGGWPLNVFLMPDGRPFYGGTYFPNTERGRMPSWPRVLDAVSEAYHNDSESVLKNASVLTEALQASSQAASPDEPVRPETADEAFRGLAGAFDQIYGGFGSAPKFPQSMPQEFLLRYHVRTGAGDARNMVLHSLDAMAAGGIYDHLGGGFARYSTDERWLVPHFEKMLYDNALLASVYLQAYLLTREPRYETVARETLDYLLRDLRHPDGAFFSSQDADSEGVEGKFYVWSASEIDEVLGPEDGAFFRSCYGVDEGPNFEGLNILYVPGMLRDEDVERLRPLREKLRLAREQRVHPATDDKVLTAWNGLAIRALAEAGTALDEPRYRDAASIAAAFLLDTMRPDKRLLRTWKDGTAHLKGYLEDYACLINALISVHEATFEHRWLHEAKGLADDMVSLFWDSPSQCFYDVGSDHEQLIVRPRDQFDNAVPCGSSAAAEALLRLAALTGNQAYRETAMRAIGSVVPLLGRAPMGFGNWLKAVELHLAPPTEVAIVGDPSAGDTRALLDTLYSRYRPHVVLAGMRPDEPSPFVSPLFEGRAGPHATATAFACHGYVCDLPASDPTVLATQLDESPTA